mmetsp:Transcript_37294/g.117526  ORF Transcript_37294/g.117526 Transcript_37294/m.117526 type:complete len:218 (-) Transcript_37294:44-697(-)
MGRALTPLERCASRRTTLAATGRSTISSSIGSAVPRQSPHPNPRPSLHPVPRPSTRPSTRRNQSPHPSPPPSPHPSPITSHIPSTTPVHPRADTRAGTVGNVVSATTDAHTKIAANPGHDSGGHIRRLVGLRPLNSPIRVFTSPPVIGTLMSPVPCSCHGFSGALPKHVQHPGSDVPPKSNCAATVFHRRGVYFPWLYESARLQAGMWHCRCYPGHP